MEKAHDTVSRSLVKTISWRLIILILDFFIAYILTKDYVLATKFAIIKIIVSSLFYYFHERFWNKLAWGKA